MPRPDLDAIRERQHIRWSRLLNEHGTDAAKTDGLLNDLDALLDYVEELEGKMGKETKNVS